MHNICSLTSLRYVDNSPCERNKSIIDIIASSYHLVLDAHQLYSIPMKKFNTQKYYKLSLRLQLLLLKLLPVINFQQAQTMHELTIRN